MPTSATHAIRPLRKGASQRALSRCLYGRAAGWIVAPNRSWAEAGKPPAEEAEQPQVQLMVKLQVPQQALVVVAAGRCCRLPPVVPMGCPRRWRPIDTRVYLQRRGASPSTEAAGGKQTRGGNDGKVWTCIQEVCVDEMMLVWMCEEAGHAPRAQGVEGINRLR